MVINDYRAITGNNVKAKKLAQSARGTATMGDYYAYYAASFKFPPFNPDALIASKGYEELDKQLHMASVLAPLSTLRDAVLYKGWTVKAYMPEGGETPDAESQELADAVVYALNEIEDEFGNYTDFRHVIRELTYAVHVGFRVTEKIWRTFEDGPYKGKWGWSEFSAKPAQQIGYDVDPMTFKVRRITSYSPLQGYQMDILPEKVVRYTHGIQDNSPYGTAIGRTVYANSFSVNFLTRFWNFCLEKYGMPFILAMSPPQLMDLAGKALADIRNGGVGVLPTGSEAQLLQAVAGGTDGYQSAVQYHGQMIAYAYLRNVLTSNEGQHGSTSAGSDVQQDTQEYALASLRWDMEGVINRQVIRPFIEYNYGRAALTKCPTIFLGDVDEADVQMWTNSLVSLQKQGILHEEDPQIPQKLGLKPTPPNLRNELRQRRQQDQKNAATKAMSKGGKPNVA